MGFRSARLSAIRFPSTPTNPSVPCPPCTMTGGVVGLVSSLTARRRSPVALRISMRPFSRASRTPRSPLLMNGRGAPISNARLIRKDFPASFEWQAGRLSSCDMISAFHRRRGRQPPRSPYACKLVRQAAPRRPFRARIPPSNAMTTFASRSAHNDNGARQQRAVAGWPRRASRPV